MVATLVSGYFCRQYLTYNKGEFLFQTERFHTNVNSFMGLSVQVGNPEIR